jgi:hypothetical protein
MELMNNVNHLKAITTGCRKKIIPCHILFWLPWLSGQLLGIIVEVGVCATT